MSDAPTSVPKDRQPIIESASATTDPDNANSGPFAYVVFVVATLLLALLVMGVTSCASLAAEVALREGGRSGGLRGVHGEGLELDLDFDFDLEEVEGFDLGGEVFGS